MAKSSNERYVNKGYRLYNRLPLCPKCRKVLFGATDLDIDEDAEITCAHCFKTYKVIVRKTYRVMKVKDA